MRIDQYLPDFAPFDAIGNHVRQVRKALRAAGVESDIYAEAIHSALRDEARPYTVSPAEISDDRLVLYHSSTNGDMATWLVEQAEAGQRTLLYYHNITPARFFDPWLPEVTPGMQAARRQLAALAPHAELALAPSRFNEEELIQLGCKATAVSPLLIDVAAYHEAPDYRLLSDLRRRQAAGGADWIFVGRLAPNKCQHDVIAAFAVYRHLHDPAARLTLVGGGTAPYYREALLDLVEELDLGSSVEWLEGVGEPAMRARFHAADVLVCCSEHEGFCVPLIEAMALGVPVVAYAAAAVPETVGDAGVLLDSKDPLEVAQAVADLLGDDDRREALVAAGRRRAAELELPVTSARLLQALAPHLAPAARR